MPRRTLTEPVRLAGVGVHSGRPCAATVRPGAGGLRFRAAGVEVPATVEHVVDTSMSTTLGRDGARVGMVEHVLSALWGLGIHDAEIAVDGPEVPILDGSARPWVDALLPVAATIAEAVAPRRVVVELSARGGLDALGPRRVAFDFGTGDYARDVAWARTFVHAADVDRLLAAGMGAGATAENTLVVPAVGEPPPPVRGPSEPARHKLLDAIGDLALLGRPHAGTIVFVDSGHAGHVEAVRRIAAGRD